MKSYHRGSGKPLGGAPGDAFAAAARGRYVFTIEADVKAADVGQSPEGERLDLQYGNPEFSEISTDADLFVADWWAGLAANDKTAIEKAIDLVLPAPAKPPKAANPPNPAKPPPPPPLKDYEKVFAFRKLDPDQFDKNPAQKARYDAAVKVLTGSRLGWFGFDGKIVSGSDWLLVRNDAVAVFSGRLTVGSGDADGSLIDATISSVLDITPPNTPRAIAFQNVQKGQALNPLPLLLSIVFDVAGAAEAWAPQRIIKQAEGFWKYQMLTQAQFIAIGEATVDARPYNPINRVHVDVYELRRT
jgi:hypothetical protein